MPYVSPTGDVTPIGTSVLGAGILTGAGFLMPSTGGKVVAYVGTWNDSMPEDIRQLVVPAGSFNQALARCTASRGDTVMVLPGTSISIDAADKLDSLVAGTRIVGMGSGTLRPTLTWTTATATLLFDAANVVMSNFILKFAAAANGGVTVAAPMTWSADGCGLVGCPIFFGDDANDIVGTGILVEDAADCFVHGCHAIGATAAECTSFLDLHNADRFQMTDTIIEGATSNVAVGVVRFVSEASLNIRLERNTYINRKALSTCAVTGLAAVSGTSRDEFFHYLDDASDTAWLTSTGIMAFYNAKVVNLAGENALVATVVSV